MYVVEYYLISKQHSCVSERPRQLQRVRIRRGHVGEPVHQVERVRRHVVRALRRVRLHVPLVVHRWLAQDALRERRV